MRNFILNYCIELGVCLCVCVCVSVCKRVNKFKISFVLVKTKSDSFNCLGVNISNLKKITSNVKMIIENEH